MMLQRLQNLCFKLILHVDKRTPTMDIHAEMNMDLLQVRRSKHVAVEMYKVDQHLLPESVQNLFHKSQHCYATRSRMRGDYHTQRKRLEYGKRCFMVRGPKVWHIIPPEVKLLPDITVFKDTLKIMPWSAESIPIT